MAKKGLDDQGKGLGRREVLECMVWAGTGASPGQCLFPPTNSAPNLGSPASQWCHKPLAIVVAG
jgi:hypothetical protein